MGESTVGVWPRFGATGPEVRFAPGISVFFPAYNDALSLPSLLARTFETLRRVAADYEVIVVNDGSTDDTAEVLEDLRRKYSPFLRIVTHAVNRGYGAALRSGFAAATKDYVFYTDGDSQYDPAELENLLRLVTSDTGLVNGYKLERSDPWHRVAIGWLYNRFARWLFRIRLRDIDCDFRLIRRSALDLDALQSTGGTICVELVRTLEMSGAGVVETPVHHYARPYGRSQFFRVRSLAVTFWQLCAVFFRLVLWPSIGGIGRVKDSESARFSRRQQVLVAASVFGLAALAYGRTLWLPFISDDYIQIQLGRDYGPFSHWGTLAGDALYRCRATSLVFTYWLERWAGLTPFSYNFSSLLLHVANSLLVFALGRWRPLGWRVSAVAACFFAVSQRHSEAVVWFAAIPELLVFFFVLAGFLCWIRWLEGDSSRWLPYLGALGCYLLALLSKESAVAVVPLYAFAVVIEPSRRVRQLWGLAPFAAVAVAYFALGYVARQDHLHYNDGTFSFTAPFVETLARSVGRLYWLWGGVSLALLFTPAGRPWRGVAKIATVWMILTLLPYSFLTYMPRVPSRHTYLASVGQALVVAAGLLTVRQYARRWNRVWPVPAMAGLILIDQCGYMWTVKHYQYSERARPTEELISLARKRGREIRAKCFPYSPMVAQSALQIALGEDTPGFKVGPEAALHPDAVDFCNANANGVHY
jgi:glycosyltransferase involved in cell wall biosynthesis